MPFFALLSISSLFFASCEQEKIDRSAGISYDEDARAGLILTTLVLAVIPEAMSHIPNIGGHLGTIAGNLATAAAAAAASSIAIGLFHTAKDDLMGLGK